MPAGLGILALVMLTALPADAQTSVRWQLIADAEPSDWSPGRALPMDSLRTAARGAIHALQRSGYYLARLDSVTVDSAAAVVRLHATRGPRVPVGAVVVDGARVLDADRLRAEMNTRPGQPLDPEVLEADLAAILRLYEAEGYPLAQVFVEDVVLTEAETPELALRLRLEEGEALPLVRVELDGAERTSPRFAARIAGLQTGRPLVGYDPGIIRQRLQATNLFREVGPPELLLDPDGGAVLRIPIDEEPPGSFDLVLGYQPPSGGGSGSLVGNGHLVLRNLFGGGRRLALKLNRLPGRVSTVDAGFADPYLFGAPLAIEGRFEGVQQDSTYGQQRYRAEAGYRFGDGLELFGTASREVTRPGQGGLALVGGRQRVPRSSAWFFGLGVRFARVDDVVNPRSGLLAETNLEQGRKARTLRRVTPEQDTTLAQTSLQQARLSARMRVFVPTWRRQSLVLGSDAAVLRSDEYDISDLFRFGGAASLRGYDEDRFRGRVTARALAEYRYLLDRRSYAFAFFDLGYVETPAVADFLEQRGFHPGYGFGAQFSTDIGLITASYALSPEDGPTGGRVHVGLSVGL